MKFFIKTGAFSKDSCALCNGTDSPLTNIFDFNLHPSGFLAHVDCYERSPEVISSKQVRLREAMAHMIDMWERENGK